MDGYKHIGMTSLVDVGVDAYRKGDERFSLRLWEMARAAGIAEGAYNLGWHAHQREELAEAEGLYLEAIGIRADFADAHQNLAIIYEGQHKWMRALRHWRAVRACSDNADDLKEARARIAALTSKVLIRGDVQ